MYATNKDNTATAIRDEINDAKNDLRGVAKQAGSKVRSLFNSASDEITHATDAVTKQVRSNPVQSSLIALGAGFILGALFRR